MKGVKKMTENLKMTEDEKQAKMCEMYQLLAQNDYIARKVAFEVAEVIKKLFPDVNMPEYTKYKDKEEQAREFRKTIDELRDL